MTTMTNNYGSSMSPFGLSFLLTARASSGLIRLRALIGICALALQMLAPIAAHSANTGEWIVICGENGPELIQVQLSDEAPSPCPKCDECTFCQLMASTGNTPSSALNSRDLPMIKALHVHHGGNVMANPAQFWHENRGPPRFQTTPISDGASRPSHAATLSQGGVPCT